MLCEIRRESSRGAARRLGIALGTLSSRLAKARKILGERLGRRGIRPAVAVAVALPPGLARAATDCANGLASGNCARTFKRGTLKIMLLTTLEADSGRGPVRSAGCGERLRRDFPAGFRHFRPAAERPGDGGARSARAGAGEATRVEGTFRSQARNRSSDSGIASGEMVAVMPTPGASSASGVRPTVRNFGSRSAVPGPSFPPTL